MWRCIYAGLKLPRGLWLNGFEPDFASVHNRQLKEKESIQSSALNEWPCALIVSLFCGAKKSLLSESVVLWGQVQGCEEKEFDLSLTSNGGGFMQTTQNQLMSPEDQMNT